MVIGSIMILLEFFRLVFQTLVYGIYLIPTEGAAIDLSNY